jgi:hypothetical protein
MSSEEITKLYSGKTAQWSRSSAYFSPDNTIKGVFGKPKVETTFKGRWTVTGNEICMEGTSARSGRTVTDCWKYWRAGKDIFTLTSRRFDGGKIDEVNGYRKDEVNLLKNGDLVSKEYAEAGGT